MTALPYIESSSLQRVYVGLLQFKQIGSNSLPQLLRQGVGNIGFLGATRTLVHAGQCWTSCSTCCFMPGHHTDIEAQL